MVIVVVECANCGQTFGIRPGDIRDRRCVHCIHCGKYVVVPRDDETQLKGLNHVQEVQTQAEGQVT